MKQGGATIIGLTLFAFLAGGCATGTGGSGDIYSYDPPRREQAVLAGVVESVREVQIEGTSSGIGPSVGAIVGGIAGGAIGQGRGAAVGSVLGGAAGAVAGRAAEQSATRQLGHEITVRLDSGRVMTVTQAAGEVFQVGDRVQVVTDGATTRVTR